MTEHPVKSKLRRALLPYVVSGRRLQKERFARAYAVYLWTNEMLAALASVGLGTTLLPVNLQASSFDLPALFRQGGANKLSIAVAVSGALITIAWVALKVIVTREDGLKRAALANSCSKQLRNFSTEIHQELVENNPMPKLDEIHRKINDLIRRCSQENAWVYEGPAPNIDAEVASDLERLCGKYETYWTAVPIQQAQQIVPTATPPPPQSARPSDTPIPTSGGSSTGVADVKKDEL